MGGSTHIATQNGWNKKKRSIGDNLVEWKHCASLLFLSTPVPLPMVFRSFLSVLCLGLCWLSVLCFVFSLFLGRSVFVCANPCDRDTMGHRSKTRILDPRFSHILRFAPYNGGFMPEVWNSKNFVLLGLHTELWVEAPTSQPKTDGTGKSEAFGDNCGNGIGMEASRFLAFLVNPRSAPNGFPFLRVCRLFWSRLGSVLCFVFSAFLVLSVFICENPCDRDTMGHRSKTRILDPPIFAHFALRPL